MYKTNIRKDDYSLSYRIKLKVFVHSNNVLCHPGVINKFLCNVMLCGFYFAQSTRPYFKIAFHRRYTHICCDEYSIIIYVTIIIIREKAGHIQTDLERIT